MDRIAAPKIYVVPATVCEWPQIESLRRGYFEPRCEPIQRRDSNTHWMVALDDDGNVFGCYSFIDEEELRQRWVMDFYRSKGHAGGVAVRAMWKHLVASAKASKMVLAGTVAPDNLNQLGAMHRRGFKPVGIIMLLDPEDDACHQQ